VLPLRKLGKQKRRSTDDGRFLQRSLRHEPRSKRMKLVETYLVCGSITETARRRNLLESGSQAGPLLGRGGFPGFGTVPDVPIPLLPKSHPTSRPRSGKRENAQITEGKGFPGSFGRRRAWFSHPTRSATSCGAWGTPAGERGEKRSIRPNGLGRRNGRLRLSRWT